MKRFDASKWRALARASLALAVAFGLGLTGEQVASMTAVTELVIIIVKDTFFPDEPSV